MRQNTRHPGPQKGLALIAMLSILVVAATAVLVGTLSATALRNAQQTATSAALAKAKEVLIGYAITYGDTHPGLAHGYLPCPDPNGTVGGINNEGSSDTCGIKNVSAIGRFPWKSLKLPEQRDGTGECLWYTVAGTYKNNPKTDLMNWDTSGLLELVDASGNVISRDIVAVVFAAGVPLGTQIRVPDGSAPVCGGNYTASYYLDRDVTLGINNASPSTVAKATSRFIATAPSLNINDQSVYITAADIFNTIKRRNDFATFVATLLSSGTACLSSLPSPVNINFNTLAESGSSGSPLIAGRISSSTLTACSDSNKELVRQWRDNLLYAKCNDGECKVNGTECNKKSGVNGMLIFSGARGTTQLRSSNADKNSWANYLEGNALTMFSTGATSVSGAAVAYNPANPTTDVVACIP